MAALSSSRFYEARVRPTRAPATYSVRSTPHRMVEVLDIAVRARAAVAEAAVFLWTLAALGFLASIIVGLLL